MSQPVQMSENEVCARMLVECQNDPLLFVNSAYPWGVEGTSLENASGPREWQHAELSRIAEHLNGPNPYDPYRSSVASGHGIGKSCLISWLMHWGISTMVDAKGVVTANTESQLRTKTWPEMRKWYAMLRVRDWFRVDNTVFRSSDKELELTWRIDAIPWSTANTESFAGLHNELKRILLLFDEASAIDDQIWSVSEGALTDMDTQILWIVFGNPTRPQGRFYQTFNADRHRWHHAQIDSRNVEGTNKKQLAEWVEDYGEDSDFVRVRVRGQFPRSATNQLIPTESVTNAAERDLVPRLSDPLIFGLDVSRFGGDESVLQTRKGLVLGARGTFKWRGLSLTELASRVASKIIELKPDYVFIDGGGVGGGVVDILLERGFDVIEVSFGGAPNNKDFANKRAEMWCNLRDWMLEGDIPWDDQDLIADLTNQTYRYRENKAQDLVLTSKELMIKDGLPSPDTGDASALTLAEFVMPVVDPDVAGARGSNADDDEYIGDWE
jgi:hypothetical protein